MPSPSIALHPDVSALEPLLGVWSGRGHGSYPTIESFDYLEELRFEHVGKPFVAYGQRTRHAADGRPLHAETGYWRRSLDPVDGGPLGSAIGIEVMLAHPTGLMELLVGTLEAGVIELRCQHVVGSPTAKSVIETVRHFELDGDELRYRVAMAAVGQPLTHHLEATLRRQ